MILGHKTQVNLIAQLKAEFKVTISMFFEDLYYDGFVPT